MRRIMASVLALAVLAGGAAPRAEEGKTSGSSIKVEAGAEAGHINNDFWWTYLYAPYLKVCRYGDGFNFDARVRSLFTNEKEEGDPGNRVKENMDGWDARGLVGLSDTQEGLTGTLLAGVSWHSFNLELEDATGKAKAKLEVMAVEAGGRVSGKLSDNVTLAAYGTAGVIAYGTYETEIAGVKDHCDTNNGIVAEVGITLDWQLSRHWGLLFGAAYEHLHTEPETGPQPVREPLDIAKFVGQLGLNVRF